MKKIPLIALFLLPITIFFAEPAAPAKIISYTGTVQFPWLTDLKKIPALTLYYKGALVECKDGGYLFTDTEKKATFHLVITNLQKPVANTIEHVEVPKGSAYTSYTLTKKPVTASEDTFEETWDIEKKEGYGPYVLPKDALIIVMDPRCIAAITTTPWPKEGIIMKLPTITFKKDATHDANYNKSLLASLDLRPFHANDISICNKQTPKSISAFRK